MKVVASSRAQQRAKKMIESLIFVTTFLTHKTPRMWRQPGGGEYSGLWLRLAEVFNLGYLNKYEKRVS